MKPNEAIRQLAELDIRSGCSRGRVAGFTYITGGRRRAYRLFFYAVSGAVREFAARRVSVLQSSMRIRFAGRIAAERRLIF